MQLTYKMLWQILLDAEALRDNEHMPQAARDNAIETVSLCNQRMKNEGITRKELKSLAKQDASFF